MNTATPKSMTRIERCLSRQRVPDSTPDPFPLQPTLNYPWNMSHGYKCPVHNVLLTGMCMYDDDARGWNNDDGGNSMILFVDAYAKLKVRRSISRDWS